MIGRRKEKVYSNKWIHKLVSKDHWITYWYQQYLMEGIIQQGDKVLEIGHGSGFTANYLRNKNIMVDTLDNDPEKKPTIIADVTKYDFPKEYDFILAFEVFEHLEFPEFVELLDKLNKVCRKKIFLSIPRNEKICLRFSLRTPVFNLENIQISTIRKKIITKTHYWELDHPATPKKMVEEVFIRNSFTIERKLKVFKIYFYVLNNSAEKV
jgi:2-polyprenyl-3-methyl-5-hydroxy-6-metoxy-1,4-benzoquinol methylase